jgi:hypothetical protein
MFPKKTIPKGTKSTSFLQYKRKTKHINKDKKDVKEDTP